MEWLVFGQFMSEILETLAEVILVLPLFELNVCSVVQLKIDESHHQKTNMDFFSRKASKQF